MARAGRLVGRLVGRCTGAIINSIFSRFNQGGVVAKVSPGVVYAELSLLFIQIAVECNFLVTRLDRRGDVKMFSPFCSAVEAVYFADGS